MTRAMIIAAFALSGCAQLPGLLTDMPFKLPTPAEICALTPAQQAVLADAIGSTVEAMGLACAVAG